MPSAPQQVLEQNYRLKLLYSPDYREINPQRAMQARVLSIIELCTFYI